MPQDMLLPPTSEDFKLDPKNECEDFAYLMNTLTEREKRIPYTLDALVDSAYTTAVRDLNDDAM